MMIVPNIGQTFRDTSMDTDNKDDHNRALHTGTRNQQNDQTARVDQQPKSHETESNIEIKQPA